MATGSLILVPPLATSGKSGEDGLLSSWASPVRRSCVGFRKRQIMKVEAKGKRGNMAERQFRRPPPPPPLPTIEDDGNPKFVIFIRTANVYLWYPLSLITGGTTAKIMVAAKDNFLGKYIYKDTLARNLAAVLYKGEKEIQKTAFKQYRVLRSAKEFRYGYKLVENSNIRSALSTSYVIEGLVNQLKEAVPAMQKSIAELTEEVNNISPIALDEYNERSNSPTQAQSSGRIQENTDQLVEMASNLSIQSGKVSGSPVLKLPHLFSLIPNSSGKSMHAGKRNAAAAPPNQSENIPAMKSVGQPSSNDYAVVAAEDEYLYALNLRRNVREAALSGPSSISEISDDKSSDESEHFFVPLPTSLPGKEVDAVVSRRKQLPFSAPHNTVECLDKVFSPPFVMNDSFFEDAYEDLLAPLSETDAALMGSPSWLEDNSPNVP